jgi:hypothetical protein
VPALRSTYHPSLLIGTSEFLTANHSHRILNLKAGAGLKALKAGQSESINHLGVGSLGISFRQMIPTIYRNCSLAAGACSWHRMLLSTAMRLSSYRRVSRRSPVVRKAESRRVPTTWAVIARHRPPLAACRQQRCRMSS